MSKICIVSSCGGHLTEVRQLKSAYEKYEYFYVLNEKVSEVGDMIGRTYFIAHGERGILLFYNVFEAFLILIREKPDVILSTGASPAVPFALVGRFFFGCKILFIETITRVKRPSMTGRFMYFLAHDFIFQWESLRPHFPRGRCRKILK